MVRRVKLTIKRFSVTLFRIERWNILFMRKSDESEKRMFRIDSKKKYKVIDFSLTATTTLP